MKYKTKKSYKLSYRWSRDIWVISVYSSFNERPERLLWKNLMFRISRIQYFLIPCLRNYMVGTESCFAVALIVFKHVVFPFSKYKLWDTKIIWVPSHFYTLFHRAFWTSDKEYQQKLVNTIKQWMNGEI